MSDLKNTSQTLFDKNWYNFLNLKESRSYPVCLEQEENNYESDVDETELSVFSHALEHEINGYESRGYLSGPIKVVTRYAEPAGGRISRSKEYIILPTIADKEYVDFKDCQATKLLLVDSPAVFHLLVESSSFQKLGLLLITGCGIPRLTTRRFIHRLSLELDIAVHLLTDNDTWGYFIYSLLLRGAIGPHASFPWAAINDVNYLGLRAGDCEPFNLPERLHRNWKDIWTPRLNALREYECFQSAEWQSEFRRFENQHYAVNLEDIIESLGVEEFVKQYLLPRLR